MHFRFVVDFLASYLGILWDAFNFQAACRRQVVVTLSKHVRFVFPGSSFLDVSSSPNTENTDEIKTHVDACGKADRYYARSKNDRPVIQCTSTNRRLLLSVQLRTI